MTHELDSEGWKDLGERTPDGSTYKGEDLEGGVLLTHERLASQLSG